MDTNYFIVNIELVAEFSSIQPEPKIELGFKGIGGAYLPPLTVKPGNRYRYRLPSLIDDTNIDVSVNAARPGSKLADCGCFELKRQNSEIRFDVPEDWLNDDDTATSFAVHLS